MSKPRQWTPYQSFDYEIRDRDAYRVRNGTFEFARSGTEDAHPAVPSDGRGLLTVSSRSQLTTIAVRSQWAAPRHFRGGPIDAARRPGSGAAAHGPAVIFAGAPGSVP